jgi:hypothetical protein
MCPPYVPRGKLWLSDALGRLTCIRQGIAAGVFVPDSARIKETRELKEALAEGDLAAIIIQENGDEYQVPEKYWRRPNAEQDVRRGYASWPVRGLYPVSDAQARGHVLLVQADFENWVQFPASRGAPSVSRDTPDAGPAQAANAKTKHVKNPPGRAPGKRRAVIEQMIKEYAGKPNALEQAKQAHLMSAYNSSADLIVQARREAVAALLANTDRIPTKAD